MPTIHARRSQMAPATSYCSVEKGSFILGIFSSIVSCAVICLLMFLAVVISVETYKSRDPFGIIYVITMVVLLFICIVNLMFSVKLSRGVMERNAEYVKRYYVYGKFLWASAIITGIYGICRGSFTFCNIYFLLSYVVFINLYPLLLLMVYKTCQRLTEDPVSIPPESV